MSGKINIKNVTFKELFDKQANNQQFMIEAGKYDEFKSKTTEVVPVDDVKLASYHVQQLMSEVGEVLDADKRWKNIRNDKYDRDAKLDELADCFIVLINIAMFSGIDGEEMANEIFNKIGIVNNRIKFSL